MLAKLIKLLTPKPKPIKVIPPYILVPDEFGTYTLEYWEPNVGVYLCKAVWLQQDEAEAMLKNLSRKTLYWKE